MKDDTLYVIQKLNRHIVPTHLLMKIREITQGDVSTHMHVYTVYVCFIIILLVISHSTVGTVL